LIVGQGALRSVRFLRNAPPRRSREPRDRRGGHGCDLHAAARSFPKAATRRKYVNMLFIA
jgi:hypothetical protein